jgi:hypothetical protein
MFKTISKSLFLLSFFITSSFATTYVVDANAQCRWWGEHSCRNTCLSPNWSTNNFNNIQDAVNAASDSSSSSPDTIEICDGTYNESIITQNNANALTIKAASGQDNVKIVSGSYGIRTQNSTNLTVENLSIEADNNAIDFRSNAGSFRLKNLKLRSNSATALYVRGAGNNFLIDNVKILYANQEAIHLENGNNGLIKDSCIGNSSGIGLHVLSSNSLEVTQTCFGNVAEEEKEALLESGSNNPYFHDNYWERHDVSGINTNDSTLSSCPHSCGRDKFSGEHLRPFTQLYKKDLYGDMKIFGNTILGERKCTEGYYDWWGNLVCTKYSNVTTCPADDANNAQISAGYVDTDGDSSTYNSSSSNLVLETGSTIKKAYLYWQGLASVNDYQNAVNIKLKVPNSSSYINIKADDSKVNWTQDSGYFPYQATVDITEYMNGSGAYSVADLFTMEGRISGLGTYGAWSIVVVYENENETLKNISIYDGYAKIYTNSQQTLNLSGFLTPTNGVVNSKFLVFAGEGDVDISGDYIELDGTKLKRNDSDDGNNAFNSSITENGTNVTSRNPSCQNNLGIDIHTYDVGTNGQNIIQNSQTSAEVKLGSDGDMYFPSVFAFSTELYIPDICYEEVITKDGEPATNIFAGDTLESEVTIANMSSEPAKGVSLKRVFGEGVAYSNNTTKIKESGVFVQKTDAQGDDTVSFIDSSDSLILNLGNGSNQDHGGLIILDQNETFQYKFVPQADGNLTSYYLVTYTDESDVGGAGTVTYSNVPIGKCSNRDITSTIIPILPSGTVRIVEQGKDWNYMQGALFTKVVNLPTHYDILYATNENGDTLTSGEISKIELIDLDDRSHSVIATLLDSVTRINQRQTFAYTFTRAYRRLQFRITLTDGSFAYSNDFSVRPASFGGDISATAGEDVPLSADTITTDLLYDATLNIDSIDELIFDPVKTCAIHTKEGIINTFDVTMENGKTHGGTIRFNDVGKFDIKLKDTTWTGSSDDQMNAHCINDSVDNTTDGEGRYGCDFEGIVHVSIQPYELNITDANFTASTLQDWLYDANISDMNVTASATVQANNAQHNAVQNFTANCYAQNVNVTFYYDFNNTNVDANISYIPAALGIGHHFTDINKTITIPSTDFIAPSASTNYSFNINRAYNTPFNPISIELKDVNVTTNDVAKIENNATVNSTKTFYYGRVVPTDIRTNQTPVIHSSSIQVFVDANWSQKANWLANGHANWEQKSINWYQMRDDNISSVINFTPRVDFAFANDKPGITPITPTQGTNMGRISFVLANNWGRSDNAYIHLDIPNYLWFNNYSDYNSTGDCATHPCFRYIFYQNNSVHNIHSGDFNASNISDRNYTRGYEKAGVKTFR